MKNLISLRLFPILALALSASAQAAHFDRTFFGNSGGQYTMVSCDYAEPVLEAWLEKFGATSISVYCSGGIQPYGVFPITVQADYAPPVVTTPPSVEALTIESDPFYSNCTYDTDLMRALLRDFTNITTVRARDFCFDPSSRYRYDLRVNR